MGLNTFMGIIFGLAALAFAVASFYSPLYYPGKTVIALWSLTAILTLISGYNLSLSKTL